MTKRHLHLRRLAVGGASVALAATGLAVSTAPAHAATGEVDYTCSTIAGDMIFKVDTDTNAPAKMVAGQKTGALEVTSTVTIPGDLASLIHLVGGRTADGTAVADSRVGGKQTQTELTVPSTEIPEAGDLQVVASGLGAPVVAKKAGKLEITAGDFVSTLHLYDENGDELDGVSPAEVPCTAASTVVDTIKVAKAGSKTKLKVNGKKKKAVVKVKVASKTSVKAKGKVKVALKGPKKVTKKVKINKKGVAKFAVKKLKKGKYKVNAKYLGNKNVKASKAKAKVKVK